MLEKQIETILLNKFRSTFEESGIEDVQLMGVWDTSEALKGYEEGKATGILSIKVSPRAYDTPTIPYANIHVELALTMRTDKDAGGTKYLNYTELISNVLQRWQNSFSTYEIAFSLQGFIPSGFQIAGGDCGFDKESGVWQYAQSFEVLGVVADLT